MESTYNNPNQNINQSGKRSSSSGSSEFSRSSGSSSTSYAGEKLSSQVGEAINKVKNVDMNEQMEAIRSKYDELYSKSYDTIRRNPMMAVGGAAFVGFLLGVFFCRK